MAGTHYIASLGNLDRADYINKLVLRNGEKSPDPHAIPDHEWVLGMSKWPSIIWPDIYTYLMEKPSVYTNTKWALHRLSLPFGPSGPQSALFMDWSHSFLLFLAKGCDPHGILNILQPSFLQFVQFTAQQLLVISLALLKMQ